jgi:hypothetical protein
LKSIRVIEMLKYKQDAEEVLDFEWDNQTLVLDVYDIYNII